MKALTSVAQSAPEPGQVNNTTGATFHILVATANEATRRVIVKCLTSIGHDVVHASDGFEALEHFNEKHFPIVVASMDMPGMRGIDLLKHFRAERPDTQVILISASVDTHSVIEAFRYGASNFIEKPFTEAEFLQQMEPTFHKQALALENDLIRRKSIELQEKDERERRMVALGRLLAGIVHEIRNPLAFVMANTEIIENSWKEIQHQIQTGEPVNPRAMGEMAGLVRDLRHGLHRLETITDTVQAVWNNHPAGRRETDLSKLMESSFRLAMQNKPKEIQATVDLPPKQILVEVNRSEIETCLLNLLANAFDGATLGGSVVKLYSREIPYPTSRFFGFVEIVVEDDGPGIPQAIIDEVFTPFFTTKSNATGLGLSIAYEYAKRNGAQVEIDSREGVGTVVTVRLAFRLPEEPPTT